MTVRVSGLDLSITATGAAHTSPDGGEGCTHVIKTKGTKDDRLVVIKNQVLTYTRGSELVLIEGYLNKSMSAGITGMVHGAVRSALIEAGTPYATIPPASLKKYATGNGSADKTAMALAAFKRAGEEFKDDNQCDAWWCWVALRDKLGSPLFTLPAINRESLAKIKMEG